MLDGNDSGVAPEAFELIEAAQRGMKQVDDHIHIVEERPAPLRDSFGVMDRLTGGPQSFDQMLGGAAHVRVRRSAGDHEEIGHVRHTAQVQDNDVLAWLSIHRHDALRQRGAWVIDVGLCAEGYTFSWVVCEEVVVEALRVKVPRTLRSGLRERERADGLLALLRTKHSRSACPPTTKSCKTNASRQTPSDEKGAAPATGGSAPL